MAGCTADQTPQHIAPALVAGHNAVGNQKSSGTHMVGNQPDGYVVLLILLVGFAGYLAYLIPDCLHRINVKHGTHVLHYHCKTLQTHPCVNVFCGKFLIVPMPVPVKLGKYVIPNLHKAVAVAAYLAVWSAAAISFPAVIVNFRTRPARPCPMLPEVVAFPIFIPVKPGNLFRWDAYLFCPDFKSFIVLPINGRVQPFRIHADGFRQKFPAPRDGFMLEIIPKGKVPKHFKKSKVPCRFPYIFNVPGPDTFLAGSHPLFRRNLLPGKIWLQRRHPCID